MGVVLHGRVEVGCLIRAVRVALADGTDVLVTIERLTDAVTDPASLDYDMSTWPRSAMWTDRPESRTASAGSRASGRTGGNAFES